MISKTKCGELIALTDGLVYGWAVVPNSIDMRAVVEIHADGVAIGHSTADIFDESLLKKNIGDGCHAFVFPLPKPIIHDGSKITALLANTNIPLAGALYSTPEQTSKNSSRYIFRIINHTDLRITGWCFDQRNTSETIEISFFEGYKKLTSCVANLLSAELLEKKIGDGKHAFSCTLPSDLADGRPHSIRVQVGDVVLNELSVYGERHNTSKIWRELLSSNSLTRYPILNSKLHTLYSDYIHLQHIYPKSYDFDRYDSWLSIAIDDSETFDARIDSLSVNILIVGTQQIEKTIQSVLNQFINDGSIVVGVTNPEKFLETVTTDKNIIKIINSIDLLNDAKKSDSPILFVRSGDLLKPNAVFHYRRTFYRNEKAKFIYSDCEVLFSDTGSILPWCKPTWDPFLEAETNYASMGFACRPKLLSTITDPYLNIKDFAYHALSNCTTADSISNISEILFTTANLNGLPGNPVLIESFLKRHLKGYTLIHGDFHAKLVPSRPRRWPKVSIIIPTRDGSELLRSCIESLKITDYPNFEVIIIDNGSVEQDTINYLEFLKQQTQFKIIKIPGHFNYSKLNNAAVREATGKIICLLNNDIEVLSRNWLTIMVSHLTNKKVGAVGAKLLWPNRMVQHAGVVLGLNGLAGHVGNNWFESDDGYFGLNQVTRQCSAVTAACLVVRKKDFVSVGGLDEIWLQVNFNDVDLCLKLREKGKYIVWTPDALLIHHESASRGSDHEHPSKTARTHREIQVMRDRWKNVIFDDPFYSPNLNLDRYPYTGLSIPKRRSKSI